LLESKLEEFRTAGKHQFPGTSARSVVRNHTDPASIELVLVWQAVVMPTADQRQIALAALRADLAEMVEWDQAQVKHGEVLLHA
jgi:hypothetical protein